MTTEPPAPGLVALARLALPAAEPAAGAAGAGVGSAASAVVPLYWRGGAEPDGTGGLRFAHGARADLGTWFNAAPVGWWRNLLGCRSIRLDVSGLGELVVWRHTVGGTVREVDRTLAGAAHFDFPIGPDDRWMWLEIRGADAAGYVESASWSTPVETPAEQPQITVVVPTFGREQDALAQVRRLLAAELADVVARVIVVDQSGTVRGADGADAVIADAGERLTLIEQGNLGGSGGYARGMIESRSRPDDAVLLLDDDARIEPEGLRRMLTLQTLHRLWRPSSAGLMVGTPLLSAEEPTVVAALAEGVRRGIFDWGPSDGLAEPVDVGARGPAGWGFADPRARTDYAGWWGTLLPPGAVERVGLPAPYFLKWDDAEYGLRARRRGFAVATVPGSAVWHPTWAAKGTIFSWAAWPLHRNRLATAAAYGASRGVLVDSLVHQVKHILSLQYGTAELWNAALTEFADGPGWLRTGLATTREAAQAAVDAMPREPTAGADALFDATGAGSGEPAGAAASAGGALVSRLPESAVRAVRSGRAALGVVLPPRERSVTRVAAADFTWRDGLGRDVVLLDGDTPVVLRRDPRRARAALRRTVAIHARLAWRWSLLRRRYAAALPRASSAQAWNRIFRA